MYFYGKWIFLCVNFGVHSFFLNNFYGYIILANEKAVDVKKM